MLNGFAEVNESLLCSIGLKKEAKNSAIRRKSLNVRLTNQLKNQNEWLYGAKYQFFVSAKQSTLVLNSTIFLEFGPMR